MRPLSSRPSLCCNSGVASTLRCTVPFLSGARRDVIMHVGAGRGAGPGLGPGTGLGRGGRKSDYLDFDWEDNNGDDLADVKTKYEDFIRQERPAQQQERLPAQGYGYTGRRRQMSSRSYDRYDMYDDDFEDDFEDDRPMPPRAPEKRFLNGKHILTNSEITAPLLRILGPLKEQLGPKPRDEALKMAMQQGMDLILINPEMAPPVARILQWSKFKFELEQNEKSKKSKATVVETKEIRLSPKTDDNDINVKLKSSAKFLDKGNKVKLTMKFEGRQLQFKDVGKEVLLKFIADLGETAKVEGPLNFKGATYTVMLIPGKSGSVPSPSPPAPSKPQQQQPAAVAAPAQAQATSNPMPPAPPPAPAAPMAPSAPAAAPMAPSAPVAPPRPAGPPIPPPSMPISRPATGAPPPPGPPRPAGPPPPGPPRAPGMPGVPRPPGAPMPPPPMQMRPPGIPR